MQVLSGGCVMKVLRFLVERAHFETGRVENLDQVGEKRGLAGVVSAHESDDRGTVIGIEEKRIAAREEGSRFLAVARDLGRRVPVGVQRFAKAGRSGQEIDRGPRIELVRLFPPAELAGSDAP